MSIRFLAGSRAGAALLSFAFAQLLVNGGVAAAQDRPGVAPLGELVVTGSLRQEPAATLPTSVSVLSERRLEQSGVQHFQDVLGLVPNLNWAAGTSRPRHFQIRGIGDLEQYQGAPNPSVAFLIDDIDLSGVGMPATLFDVQQIEVLRGPQGTRYGANALAGLVQVRTQDPGATPELLTEVSLAEDDTRAAGAVFGGAVPGTESAAVRFVVQQFQGDGFRRNAFLGRDDTNGRDELTARAKLAFDGPAGWHGQATLLFADFDNGYDAFAIDNSRVTQSDDPGTDAQRTSGGALRLERAGERLAFTSITSFAQSDIRYGFDGDWGNDAFWGENAPYDFTSSTLRDRRTFAQDLRVMTPSLHGHNNGHDTGDTGFAWLAGVYFRELAEENDQLDVFNGDIARALRSDFEARSLALYGQADWRLAPRVTLSTGLRLERREAGYADTDGMSFDPTETMSGGHLSLRFDVAEEHVAYATVARGYKNGGFNIGAAVEPHRREYAPEYLWNFETGLKSRFAEGRVESDLALFYMRRRSQQVETSFQLDPGDPLSFVFYTDNAAAGENSGVEATIAWQLMESWTIDGALGLLKARYIDYVRGDRVLTGREQAHAPSYQYAFGLTWQHPFGWMARADVTGRDAFYFSPSHDQRARVATLLNLRAGIERERWSAFVWGLNVTDEYYSQLGFFFGNEPPEFADKRYTQAGDPRQWGATIMVRFE
jgi:iron complex outermembrane receptor protein